MSNESKMISLGGLWINKDKNGGTYLSGSLGRVKLLVFKNTKKEAGSNAPDYNICMAQIEPKEKAAEEEATPF